MQIPATTAAPLFTCLLRVRYAECDGQLVVFNARYADYIDVAMTEFFRVAMGGFKVLLDQGLDNQVVSLHIDWLASAKFDDVLALAVTTNRVGSTSYTFDISITEVDANRLIAKCKIVYVMVDTQHYQKAAVPDWVREKLVSNTSLPTVNQSGIAF